MTNDLPTPDVLTVYGAGWCWDCHNTCRYLDSTRVQYRYVDLGSDRATQPVLEGPDIEPFRSSSPRTGRFSSRHPSGNWPRPSGFAPPDSTSLLTAIRDPSHSHRRQVCATVPANVELLETNHSCKKIHSIS